MSISKILKENLDCKEFKESGPKRFKNVEIYKFSRNFIEYEVIEPKMTFEEKLAQIHPYSKYGNGMASSVFQMGLADNICEEMEKDMPQP